MVLVASEKEQEMDMLPSSPRSTSTPATAPVTATAADPPSSRPGCPARSLSSSAAVDRAPSSSLLRLVTARRAVDQLLVNGDCAPSSTSAVTPTYGVDSTDRDALDQVRAIPVLLQPA